MPGTKVCQVEHQILYRIVRMLERRGDGKALPLIEKTEESSTPRRFAGSLNQTELPPCERRGHAQLHSFALAPKFAISTNIGIIPLYLGVGQPMSELVEISSC